MSVTDRSSAGAASPLVQELLRRIAEGVPPDRAEVVQAFARAYVKRLPSQATLEPEELFGQVMGLFELADGRGTEDVAVRALNPTLAGDGYTTVGTVVETNTEDSPFLVDSVQNELAARGLDVRLVIHPVIGTERDASGRLVRVLHAREAQVRESVMHFEADRRVPDDELADLEAGVRAVLGDVRRAVADHAEMRERLARMEEAARNATARYEADEIEETVAFLHWLGQHNFVFLGYREYEIADTDGGPVLQVVPGSGLGILSDESRSTYSRPVPLAVMEPRLRERVVGGDLLRVSKTNRLSTVHRRTRMDYIGIKRVDEEGRVVGELRMLGLLTGRAYLEPASRIPLLHRKLEQIVAAEDFFEGSHDHKVAVELFESFPKEELFSASWEELRRSVVALLELQEQAKVRLLARVDLDERMVSLVVALPRDRFNAALRITLQELFLERFRGSSVDYHLSLGSSDVARIHFTVHVPSGEIPDVSLAELEQEVVALARTWDDRLEERLVALHGEARGRELAERYAARLPDSYKSTADTSRAVLDIDAFERLEAGEPFVVALQNERGAAGTLTRVGLYKQGGKVQLSDFLPILEALGLIVVEEVPTRLLGGDGKTYLHDFGVLGPDRTKLDLAECGERVAECIGAVWRGEAESDSLNRLVITAGLDWRQVAVLRAYRTYRQRVSAGFTEEYQNDAFAANPGIARDLVRLFELRFDPSVERDPGAETALRDQILAALDAVPSLDQDRILRGHLGVVEATVRTNAFRPGRRHLSFKIASAAVPDMPKPYPLFEIFVYSPEMEGIHLRGGRVARGGIRWSDRLEDYRTEILGLMKAQMVKNAVIVPTGSKGGFILKRPPADRAALKEEVERQYVVFMHGLLDLTDNLVRGRVEHPPDVRVLDDDDTYLVVAADKGTAALSDTANRVAEEVGFWLGDAFASGGSSGYDHKKLGITARGAWESVKRHFRELGVDVMKDPVTVVGIGDMSGDVFGNGMLLSRSLKLVAAFDHRHVFLDPDPDPERSFEERRRLFELPGSSWADYDPSAISEGGGVWARTEKSIPISPQVRRALDIDAERLTPAELLRAVLKAPVDLLWNGGIGTFVKASTESNAEVGDRTNDAIRVDASELRVRVVGEGGNLGFTQRGRIEYALAGGRINTDAVDNSAGVDTSDHEVNLKILLGLAEQRGDLTRKQRDELLQAVVDDVVKHVLYDNYLQAQILSQEVAVSPQRLEAFEDLMVALEAEGSLERAIEFLPSTDEMAERRKAGIGLTRPELAVLMAYAKRSLKQALLHSTLPDDPYLERELEEYFPPAVVERFGYLLGVHPLKRELIATIVANDVVNSEGITFVSRTVAETGAEPADVARAYRIAREVTGATPLWDEIEALDGQIDPVLQNELMVGVDWLVERVARWYLASMPGADIGEAIAAGRDGFAEVAATIQTAGTDSWRAAREAVAEPFIAAGVSEDFARRHAYLPELVHAPDIVVVARETGRPLPEVARVFYLLGEALHLDWLESRLEDLPAVSRWQRWALQAIEDELTLVRREIAQRVIQTAPALPADEAVAAYLASRPEAAERLSRFMRSLALEGVTDLAVLTVAVRQIRGLAT